jgi:hypothetical protein
MPGKSRQYAQSLMIFGQVLERVGMMLVHCEGVADFIVLTFQKLGRLAAGVGR